MSPATSSYFRSSVLSNGGPPTRKPLNDASSKRPHFPSVARPMQQELPSRILERFAKIPGSFANSMKTESDAMMDPRVAGQIVLRTSFGSVPRAPWFSSSLRARWMPIVASWVTG